MKYSVIIKEIHLTIHSGNYLRRVRYGIVDFDILTVKLSDSVSERLFAIKATDLPLVDSIHLKYNPVNRTVSWSPKSINSSVEEVTRML